MIMPFNHHHHHHHHDTDHQPSTLSPPIISTIHPDIINTHILTRLDGPSLSSAASSSSHLRHLCTQQHLWQSICTATWPSLTHPLAANTISTFPNTHRSIFSDSFPSLHPSHPSPSSHPLPSSSELISAVDIYYKGKPVFSRVHRTETQKGWFLCSPLWIDLLEPNEMVPMPLKFGRIDDDESWLGDLEENLGLSWIVMDPTLKRAANLSSRGAVSARRHWLTGEVEVLYAAQVDEKGGAQCSIKVTCSGKPGGEMHVREVSLSMEDLEGRHVMGMESMAILQRGMGCPRRKRVEAKEAKECYQKFCVMKRESREMKLKRERRMDTVIMVVALTVFALLFWIIRSFCL